VVAPTLTIILVASAILIAAILYLEVSRPEAPFVVALRNWQTGLGAFVGLLGLTIALAVQSHDADRLQRQQLYREGLVVALAMQVEAFEVRRWMRKIDRYLSSWDEARSSKADPMVLAVECRLFYRNAKREEYIEHGIIDANRSQVGRLPNLLGVHFLDLQKNIRSLRQELNRDIEKNCNDDPELRLLFVKEAADNVKTSLDRIESGLTNLPDTQAIMVHY